MYNIDFFNFITLYNTLLLNLINRNDLYEISIYYLDNEFNIKINSFNTKEIIYKDHFKVNQDEYNHLVAIIGYDFIKNHKIKLPYFKDITIEDSKMYYLSNYSKNNILDYDKSKIHVLRNSKFELKFYYFNGLNKISYDMQDMALEKVNQKTYKKELIKN